MEGLKRVCIFRDQHKSEPKQGNTEWTRRELVQIHGDHFGLIPHRSQHNKNETNNTSFINICHDSVYLYKPNSAEGHEL